jgi:hypothetical protein
MFPREFSRKRLRRGAWNRNYRWFLARRAGLGSPVRRGNRPACSWGQGGWELNPAAGCGFPMGESGLERGGGGERGSCCCRRDGGVRRKRREGGREGETGDDRRGRRARDLEIFCFFPLPRPVRRCWCWAVKGRLQTPGRHVSNHD